MCACVFLDSLYMCMYVYVCLRACDFVFLVCVCLLRVCVYVFLDSLGMCMCMFILELERVCGVT